MGWFKKAVSKVKKAGKKVRKTRATIRKAVKKTASRVVKKAGKKVRKTRATIRKAVKKTASRVVKKAVSRAPSRPSVSRPPTRPSVYHAHSRPSVSRPPTRPSVYHAHSRPSVSRPYTPTDAIISPIITPSRITKIIQQRRKVGISAPPRITRREIPPTPIRKPTPLKTEIDKPKKIMYGEIRKEEKQKGVSRISQILSEQISRTIDKIPREKREIKKMSLRAKLTALETLKVVPDVVVGLWSLATLPPKIALLSVSKEGRKQLKENISTLPKEIQRSLEAEGKTAKLNPSQTAGRLVGLVGTTALLTKGLSKVGKLSGSLRARVSPKFVGTAKKGGILKLNLGGKKVNIKIAGKLGGKYLPKETLAAQIKLAGKKIPAVVSAQADRLVNIIKRQRIIRKPFPNEAKFSKETKRLLKKFDLKKISSNQILKLDNLIKRQGGKGILERSFFADPRGRLRPSRIGHEKEASLLDYFSGEVRYKTQKPQVLLFGDVKVQKLPNYLKEIGKKLKSNKVLTNLESNKLLKFQLKKSGKFKPIGFLSGEPEITLAPGEIIKRIKKVGVTIINKKRVPIIQTKVVKASDKLKSLLKKSNLGKLSVKELNTLKKMLKKKQI